VNPLEGPYLEPLDEIWSTSEIFTGLSSWELDRCSMEKSKPTQRGEDEAARAKWEIFTPHFHVGAAINVTAPGACQRRSSPPNMIAHYRTPS
jgi:hypothetical protein